MKKLISYILIIAAITLLIYEFNKDNSHYRTEVSSTQTSLYITSSIPTKETQTSTEPSKIEKTEGTKDYVSALNPKAQDVYENDPGSTAYVSNQDILQKNLELISSGVSHRNLYLIRVNRHFNCVTVYTFDKKGDYNVPVRAMICSVGSDNGTITGKFDIYCKYRWLALYGGVFGQYASGFYGDFLFHSVPYTKQYAGSLKTADYNLLGYSISMGCVRLSVSDSKWIYDNCDYGTTVEILDDTESPGPLGRPDGIQIPEDVLWDPTDLDEGNPYIKKAPSIKNATDITIPLNSAFNPAEGIFASDICGNDITDRISIYGTVNTKVAGTYMLTYIVTDALNYTASVDRYINVKDE